jgi:hypothetical protein
MDTIEPDYTQKIHVAVSGRGRMGTRHLLALIPPLPTVDAEAHPDGESPSSPEPDPESPPS